MLAPHRIPGGPRRLNLIQGQLFRVAGHDPMTLAAVVGVMTMVGLIACVVPAVRAARIDPGMALRAR
jgi:putative ABC transport system permease protein